MQRVTSSAHLLHHTEIVANAARLRRLAAEARALADESAGVRPRSEGLEEFFDGAEQRIMRAAASRSLGTLDLVERAVVELQLQIASGATSGPPGLRTGIHALDEILCGMRRGELGVIGARPFIGKSTLAGNIAMDVVMRSEKCPVALFSLEMRADAVLERLAAAQSDVSLYWIRNRELSAANKQRVNRALDELRHARLFIGDTSEQTIMSIRAKARRVKQRFGLGLVIVDYLQLVRSPGSENRLQEVSAVSRSLKALAGELDVPVIACAQLNRAADSGRDERPRLSHLRESGTIESDADVVILMHAVSDSRGSDESRDVELIVAKNRSGPTGIARVQFQPALLRFAVSPATSRSIAPEIAAARGSFRATHFFASVHGPVWYAGTTRPSSNASLPLDDCHFHSEGFAAPHCYGMKQRGRIEQDLTSSA
jgi:replicative DNA helicase